VLDPIDGTKGFVRGEQFCIALSLIEEGEVKLGLLGCPNLSASGVEGAGIGSDKRERRSNYYIINKEQDLEQEGQQGKQGQYGVIFSAEKGKGAYMHTLNFDGTIGKSQPISVDKSTSIADRRRCESVESSHSKHAVAQQAAEVVPTLHVIIYYMYIFMAACTYKSF
jgi:3'(2'), 5'-bisphosphate nucleotidase